MKYILLLLLLPEISAHAQRMWQKVEVYSLISESDPVWLARLRHKQQKLSDNSVLSI